MSLPEVYPYKDWKTRIGEAFSFWNKLAFAQRLTLISLLGMVLVFPLLFWVSEQQTRSRSRAEIPVTPVTPPSPTPTLPVTPPSPTSTPLLTPPVAVTNTPIPTPSSYPTRPPTPPQSNNNPVITTSSLSLGRLNKNYQAFVRGYDKDTSDKLTMTISNLPPGLSWGSCLTFVGSLKRPNIRCLISGKPTRVGSYNVGISLTDNRGGSAKQTLTLKILR